MKITQYKEVATKEEKIAMIENFVEFFSERYSVDKIDSEKNRKIKFARYVAVFPIDKNFMMFKALSKDTDGNINLHEDYSYIDKMPRSFDLSSRNGNTVKKNYLYILDSMLNYQSIEEAFNIFMHHKLFLAKLPEKGTKKEKFSKI